MGFLFGALAGYAIKKVMKLAAVVIGLFMVGSESKDPENDNSPIVVPTRQDAKRLTTILAIFRFRLCLGQIISSLLLWF
ncbi:MAG: hypothetical protein JO327_02125 [Nitrososphaeraceae archaeon]|nr:hypothetical protein [Nitrososphaeraceae archaeon]MBV9666908.1 hypothetical protein [Nitrososphaeraceae archaeon]